MAGSQLQNNQTAHHSVELTPFIYMPSVFRAAHSSVETKAIFLQRFLAQQFLLKCKTDQIGRIFAFGFVHQVLTVPFDSPFAQKDLIRNFHSGETLRNEFQYGKFSFCDFILRQP
jgi:hypothetical protein